MCMAARALSKTHVCRLHGLSSGLVKDIKSAMWRGLPVRLVGAPHALQQELAAVVNTNSHGAGAANSANTDRALGLWPALSMLNHSCRPNCVFAAHGAALPLAVAGSHDNGDGAPAFLRTGLCPTL